MKNVPYKRLRFRAKGQGPFSTGYAITVELLKAVEALMTERASWSEFLRLAAIKATAKSKATATLLGGMEVVVTSAQEALRERYHGANSTRRLEDVRPFMRGQGEVTGLELPEFLSDVMPVRTIVQADEMK